MKSVSNSDLLEMRDELIGLLHGEPGFKTVGIGKDGKKAVLVVSVDLEEFRKKTAPSTFHGVNVKLRDLGQPVAQ